MTPILIIDDTPVVEKKDRTVTIYKQKVYEDIDALSYKFAEARPSLHPQESNATSSDTAERLDGHIIARHVEFREAQLRRFMHFALKDDVEVTSANDLMILDDSFVFNFSLPKEFKDAMLDPLKDYIHRFLVWGALFDWFGASLGNAQANAYKKDLDDIKNEITNMLRVPGWAKRPMQPFGPAQKIY